MTFGRAGWIPVLLLPVALGACRDEALTTLEAFEHTDVFVQEPTPKVDILWVVDNSYSMGPWQERIAYEAATFFSRLIAADLDYHVGVITSDLAEGGVLRGYTGAVTGCTGCRYLTTQVPCPNPEIDPATATPGEIRSACPAITVFQDLIRVGVDGSPLERAFDQTVAAFGLRLDPETGLPFLDPDTDLPRLAPPAENAGFLRDDADLMLIFVADEDEGLEAVGPPVRYYERLFAMVKAAGGGRILAASVVGWPFFGEPGDPLPPAEDLCSFLSPLYDRDRSDDAALRSAYEGGLEGMWGCFGDEGVARIGERYIEISCRFGGLIANICDSSYQDTLGRLGDLAVRLGRQFVLTLGNQLDRGADCVLFTEDDFILDCDGNGSTTDPIDGPICVTVTPPDGTPEHIPHDPVLGWQFDEVSSAVHFPGDYEPPPDARIEIRYRAVPGAGSCRS